LKKHAFTLAELLAVIIILAIILAITMPSIINVIENATIEVFKIETKKLLKTVREANLLDDELDITTINQDNIDDILNISNKNYEFLELTIENDKLHIKLVGKNKWAGLISCGTYDDIIIGDVQECAISMPIYSDSEILTMINDGYIPVANVEDLNAIRGGQGDRTFASDTPYATFVTGTEYGLSSKYIQVADIDLGIPPWNNGEGWNPIGNINNRFEGEYIGNNLNIKNLTINRSVTNYQALFGYTGANSIVKNVWLQNINVTGNNYIGGLSASNIGSIENCYVSGVISGNERVGLLLGNNNSAGILKNNRSNGNATGTYLTGGLTGINFGTLESGNATGEITGLYLVGGLSGINSGLIEDSYATGKVTSTREDDSRVGGLVGQNSSNAIIKRSYVTGEVIGSFTVGGLSGINFGLIEDSYTTGKVTSTREDNSRVGGLVGQNSSNAIIKRSYVTGEVIGSFTVGGLSGINFGLIEDSYTTGKVTGTREDDTRVGGLVAENSSNGIIKRSHATGEITGLYLVGGLSGINFGLIEESYATGKVTGTRAEETRVGGLVGENGHDIDEGLYWGIISKSYATGEVSGFCSVGGLSGINFGLIEDSYATGKTTGNKVENTRVGGLVGENSSYGEITRTYSIGLVQGYVWVGGLVGINSTGGGSGAIVTASYYDSVLSQQSDNDGRGIPKTTLELKQGIPGADIYTNWETIIWQFTPSNSYPILKWTIN